MESGGGVERPSSVSSETVTTDSTRVETYIVPYHCIYSLPIRMPGMTLSVRSSRPSFQITLKGGCDENGVFEMPKESNVWKLSTLNYALGRLAYDIIWEEGLTGSDPTTLRTTSSDPLHIQTLYSTIELDEEHSDPSQPTPNPRYKLVSKTWHLDVIPGRWLSLPKSRHLLKKIQLKWQRPKSDNATPSVRSAIPPLQTPLQTPRIPAPTQQPSSGTNSPSPLSFIGSIPSTPQPLCEFRLAVATIPLKLFSTPSVNQLLDLSTIQSHILPDGKLNFSQVFGAWLVFEEDVDWSQWSASLTYWVEPN